MAGELIHIELSETIIGSAMLVLNTLKPGLDEKLYERTLAISELELALLINFKFVRLKWKRVVR